MAEQQQKPTINITVEQLFKLVQQNIRLWARPGALDKIYAQATELAQYIDHCYRQTPDKVIAQLHLHKPHFDFLTNLTCKAAIFTAIEVVELKWHKNARISIIAATLTTNVAVLPHLLKQNRGEALTDKQKVAVSKSAQLSYQKLKQANVLDNLWLHAVLTSSTDKASKHFAVGIHGTLVRSAYRFAKPLCRIQSVDNVSVGQILRQVFIDDCYHLSATIAANAAIYIHNLGSGALVMLSNNQAAILMHQHGPDNYLAFVFSDSKIVPKGRFVQIKYSHISKSLPLYQCDQPKLYSQLWEGPLKRFAEDRGITFDPIDMIDVDIYTPPKMLGTILSQLFDNPSMSKLSKAVAQSQELIQLVSAAASQASAQKLQINDTKHALAMLGLNRIGPILTRGSLRDLLRHVHYPGIQWMHNRQDSFIQAIMFYGAHNDLVLSEELAMYGAFYMAPLFFDSAVQTKSYQLYRQHVIEPKNAFALECLFGALPSSTHRENVLQLARHWQLPKIGLETLRLLSSPDNNKSAKTVESAIAVLQIAAFHCHTVFNQVDVNNPLLQQILRDNLAVLRLSFDQFIAMQDEFLTHHSPYSPLS